MVRKNRYHEGIWLKNKIVRLKICGRKPFVETGRRPKPFKGSIVKGFACKAAIAIGMLKKHCAARKPEIPCRMPSRDLDEPCVGE